MDAKKFVLNSFFIITFILCLPGVGYRFLFNLFNIPVIFQFSFSQYLINLINFHMDAEYIPMRSFNIYEKFADTSPYKARLTVIGYIKRNQIFIMKGYYRNRYFTYVAISFKPDKTSPPIRGYIYLPYRAKLNPVFRFKEKTRLLKRIDSWLGLYAYFFGIISFIIMGTVKDSFYKKIKYKLPHIVSSLFILFLIFLIGKFWLRKK